MTINPTFVEPAKVKIVTTINNVPLADAEDGELYYDATTNRLYLKTTEGWKYVAFT